MARETLVEYICMREIYKFVIYSEFESNQNA